MDFEEVGVVLLLAGDGVEHSHGQVAGQGLGNGEAAGLCHQQVAGVHVLLHLVGEVDKPGGKTLPAGQLPLEGLIQPLVAAGDDDDLHFHVGVGRYSLMMLATPKLPAINSTVGRAGSRRRSSSRASLSSRWKNTPCTGMPKG